MSGASKRWKKVARTKCTQNKHECNYNFGKQKTTAGNLLFLENGWFMNSSLWSNSSQLTGVLGLSSTSVMSQHTHKKSLVEIFQLVKISPGIYDKASVKGGAILHRVPTFGYVIVEKDQPGQLDVKILQHLGATPGPLYSKLKKGETVTFSNGVVVQPSEVLGPSKRGRKLTILGDTHDPSMMSNLARDSDALIHEATMEDALKAKAIETGHSTPSMAAEFARSVGARMLILNHFSQRYKGEDEVQEGETKGTTLQLLEEAKCALADYEHCIVMVADDAKVIDIPRCQPSFE